MSSRAISCEVESLNPSMTPSISSSLESTYERYWIHINILKWTGVVVLLALTTTSLSMVVNLKTVKCVNSTSDCIKILSTSPPNFSLPDINNTFCRDIKQYPLPDEYFATVCRYQGQLRIDIRRFINGKASIRGIALNVRQWNYLLQIHSFINAAIKDAM